MTFVPDYYQKIIAYIERNWFTVAQFLRWFILIAALLATLVFGGVSLRACELNWDAL